MNCYCSFVHVLSLSMCCDMKSTVTMIRILYNVNEMVVGIKCLISLLYLLSLAINDLMSTTIMLLIIDCLKEYFWISVQE